jgi:hypothetical protein
MRQRPCVSTPVPEQHRGRFGGCVEGLGRPRVGLGQHAYHLVPALIDNLIPAAHHPASCILF